MTSLGKWPYSACAPAGGRAATGSHEDDTHLVSVRAWWVKSWSCLRPHMGTLWGFGRGHWWGVVVARRAAEAQCGVLGQIWAGNRVLVMALADVSRPVGFCVSFLGLGPQILHHCPACTVHHHRHLRANFGNSS